MTPEEVANVKKLIDTFINNERFRENSIILLYQENEYIKIAIGNIFYLGTLASPIKCRLSESGFKCEFVERSIEEINEILDLTLDKKF